MKKLKHNDLLPWFLEDHGQLPDAYLKSCQKFFDELQATSHKQQAIEETVPHNDIEEATRLPQSDAMIDPLQKIRKIII